MDYKFLEEKTKLLLAGWIRKNDIMLSNKTKIPEEVWKVMCSFYRKVTEVKFDLYNPAICITEKFEMKHTYGISYGQWLKAHINARRAMQRLFIHSDGFNHNSGIHVWRLCLCDTNINNKTLIGITTNINTKLFDNWNSLQTINMLVNAFYIDYDKATIFSRKKKEKNAKEICKVENNPWQIGDTIEVILNCDKCQLSFCVNGQLLHEKPIEIEKGNKYYPFIQFYNTKTLYKVCWY